MKLYQVVIVGLALAVYVGAAQLVDQGQPGRQGAWPVSVSGGTLSLNSSVTVDGGILDTVTTVGTVNAAKPAQSAAYTNSAAASNALSANVTSCTTASGASCTELYFDSTSDFLAYQNITIWVRNSGANTIDNLLIEWSPDGTNFEVWDSTTFAGLVAGAIKSLALTGNSRGYLRIEGRAAANTNAVITIVGTGRSY